MLRHFTEHLRPRSILEATRADVELFLARPLKPRTRKAYLAHLRGFYRWASDMQLLTDDPTGKLRGVRVPAGVPRPVEPDLIRVALDSADPRMYAWLLCMALAGLRRCEVAVLQPADLVEVDGVPPLLYLREMKGGGSGAVPAHPALLDALHALPIRNGLWWDVSAQHLGASIAAHLRSCGINATGHQLRHSFGTAAFKASGHDLLTTSTLLRHASVATSQVYAQLDPRRPAEVVNLVQFPGQRSPGVSRCP